MGCAVSYLCWNFDFPTMVLFSFILDLRSGEKVFYLQNCEGIPN